MENKKQAIILSVIILITLVTLIVGATFAYFQATSNNSSQSEVNVTTYTSDLLTFEIGDDIAVYADQTSFASGKGNVTGSTVAKAILTANNKTNTATKNYYVYLNISENTFTYTQNENTPELLLTITDASGNAVTSISGLTYKTVTDGKGTSVSGFDITTKSGLLTLFDNREITATPAKTEEWNVTVTFVNYNVNQTGNAGKSFDAKLMIQQKKFKETIATVCSNGQKLSSCIIAMNGKDDKLYHHTSTLTNGAGDNSYRYAGYNPNNYVCLGSDATTCPEANLFRIIGVFGDQVKVIKSKSIGNQDWNTTYSNTWSTSSLNTYLNGEYLTSLGTLADKIATTTWKVGGNEKSYISQSVPSIAYQYEVGANSLSGIHNAKIGLMYVSDYYYAAGPSAWLLVGLNTVDHTKDYRAARNINWLYLGSSEWTITRYLANATLAYCVEFTGYVNSYYVSGQSSAVRPSFYLLSSTTYVSGSGTQSDPIIIG